MLAALLGALSLFAAAPATAAVLVSNLGQPTSAGASTLRFMRAQGFTTGSEALSYTLTSIDMKLQVTTLTAANLATIRAELWSDSSGTPDSSVASLTVPSSITSGAVSFAAPSGTTLTANTTYYLVVYSTNSSFTGVNTNGTSSDAEDSGAATGWSIADDSLYFQGTDPESVTTWTSGTLARQIRVNGSEGPPAAPTNLDVTPGDTKLDLSWTKPSGTVTGYDVHYTSAPSTGANAVANDAEVTTGMASAGWVDASHSGTTASQTISSLTNTTPYRVRVRAKNDSGDSDWLHGTGTPENVALPTNLCAGPPHASTITEAGGTPMIVFRPGGNPDSNTYLWVAYQLKAAADNWPNRKESRDIPAGSASDGDPLRSVYEGYDCSGSGDVIVVAGLTPGGEYDVRSHLVDGSRQPLSASTPPIRVTMWNVPGQPTGVSAAAVGDTPELALSWTAPSNTGGTGATITGYRVRWRVKDTNAGMQGDQPGPWNAEAGVDASGTSHRATGLKYVTTYEVEVRALNGIDPGSA